MIEENRLRFLAATPKQFFIMPANFFAVMVKKLLELKMK